VVEHKLCSRHGHYDQRRRNGRNDTHDKRDIVPATDTMVQPFAVMVKTFHTLVTHATVFSPMARGTDVAQMTATVLNYMGVFGAVELGYGDRHFEQSQIWVCRVKKEGSKVGRHVNQEEGS
jgi:hypothetical protein